MAESTFFSKRDAGASSSGIATGWILAITISGCALLFFTIGMLLAWHIKARRVPVTTAMDEKARAPTAGFIHRNITNRLRKNNYIVASSTASLSPKPPVLPPLPAYNSFGFFTTGGEMGGHKRRSRSWVDEDLFHGPALAKSVRDSWLKRDSWFGRMPTLPNLLMLSNAEKGEAEGGPEQEIQVQKRRGTAKSPAPLPPPEDMKAMGVRMIAPSQGTISIIRPSQTVPALPSPKDFGELQEDYSFPAKGRPRLPSAAHVRPSATDSDLKFILKSTEQRLREGKSQTSLVPTTPKSSPTKASPTKTPHSFRTTSSYANAGSTGTVRIKRMMPSPGKKASVQQGTPHSHHSRNISISSIGSAANSLLAEASKELELPGGLSSPSRAKGREWERKAEKHDLEEEIYIPGPEEMEHEQKAKLQESESSNSLRSRSQSLDSQASDSLSTVYSANEDEDNTIMRHIQSIDPFFEKQTLSKRLSWQAKNLLPMPRMRGKTMSALSPLKNLGSDIALVPAPLRPMSMDGNAKARPTSGRLDERSHTMGLAIILQPPTDSQGIRISSGVEENIPLAFPVSESLTSMLTPSVTTEGGYNTDDSQDAAMSETPKQEWVPKPINRASASIALSPSSAASSPYNKKDILSLLLSDKAPRRDLPRPPVHVSQVNENVFPTPLSPRPRRDFSQQLRRMSDSSHVASSIYDDESTMTDPAALSTGSPSKKTSLRSPRQTSSCSNVATVGNAINELRRMDSLASSYSLASIASVAETIRADNDSPTLPVLRGGGFSPSRTLSKSGNIGHKNYLSVGTGNEKRQTTSVRIKIREDESAEEAKPKVDETETPRVEVTPAPGLREDRRSANLHREPSIAGHKRLDAVYEIAKKDTSRAHHDSTESLGLYDKAGFLKRSPERMKGRRLRL